MYDAAEELTRVVKDFVRVRADTEAKIFFAYEALEKKPEKLTKLLKSLGIIQESKGVNA